MRQFKDGKPEVAGIYHGPAPLVSLINNHLSPGLSKWTSYRLIRSMGNFLNQVQLGFSAFHLTFVSTDAVISRAALGIYQGVHGSPMKGLTSIVTSPAAPFLNMARGTKMLKEWYKPGTQGENVAAQVDAMIRAGGRARMDSVYRTKIVERMLTEFRKGNYVGATMRVPFAAVEASMKPVMEWAVPRMKMGAFADMARYDLERLGPDASTAEQQQALARAWDSVDNRMGQLVYDNLFWDKTAKDVLMVTNRSTGWNLGSWRELGGAAVDTKRLILPPKTKTLETRLGVNGYEKTGNSREKREFTHRMAYAMALTFVTGMLGAMWAYAHGRKVESAKDAFYLEDSDGQRWSLPTYLKDVYHAKHDAYGMAVGKASPLITLTLEELSNKDHFGRHIRNKDDDALDQLLQSGVHIGKSFVPFSARNLFDENKSFKEKALPFVGFTPAPKWIDEED